MTEQQPRPEGTWAPATDRLQVAAEHATVGYNIEGRRVSGPQNGFGKLWRREYWADFGPDVGPETVIGQWRANFGDFWPKGGKFHGQLAGVNAGDVAPLELGPGKGPKLATGVLVIYADEESFTFMTPEGHMFAGLITFAAAEIEGSTEVRISIMLRTNDPLYEMGWPVMRIGEDTFWPGVLRNLAASFGVGPIEVLTSTTCVDRKRLWRNWRNIRHNAGIRSFWHTLTAPFRPRG